jgi:hypothetical protein
MSCCKIVAACGVFLLALQSAWAAPRESQERAARKACLLGDVAKGTEILADLYLDTKDPTHIYNQGRCFEQNGHNDQAILRFREYLRKAEHLPAADVAAVEQKIADLQAKDKGGSSAPATASPPPTAPSPVLAPAAARPLPASAAPAPATAEAPPSLQVKQPAATPAPKESPPVYKRWWFWSGVGVVVAGAVVTTVLLTSASGDQHSPPCASSGVICVP